MKRNKTSSRTAEKLLSLLLALAVCLSLGTVALAAHADFTDVKESDYFHDAVCWAVDNKITDGMTDTEFVPSGTVTRAQAVTFLWRIHGSPSEGANAFTDVPADMWYTDAVNWAVHAGVANGNPDGTFAPDAPCTREQAAAFLYRYVQYCGGGFRGMWAFPLDYSDASLVSDWAYEPLCWLTMQGIMNGYDGALDPQGLCSRGQLITMLYRCCETPAAAADPAYTEKALPVLHGSLDSAETATVRIYEDLPNVPYMSVTDFYNQFSLVDTDLTEGMTFARVGSRYTLTNFAGCSAVFDTGTDCITTDDLVSFFALAYDIQSSLDGGVDDNYPFLRSRVTCDPEVPVPQTLPLGSYDIDLRGDEGGVYAPLPTLCDLFANESLYYVVYAGEKIYTQDYPQIHQKGSALDADPDYAAWFKTDRPADLAEFTYHELCFNVDYYYGKPGQEWVHDALETQTLDELLSAEYPEIKAVLRAPGVADCCTGLAQLLWGLLYDGHTNVYSTPLMEDQELLLEVLQPLMEQEYGAKFMHYAVRKPLATEDRRAYREEFLDGGFYIEKGDTALISFDDFVVDYDGWKAFYAGEGPRPLAGDNFGTVLSGLERAAENPAIKNIVIDMSCNNGGNTGGMFAVEWLLTGEGHVKYDNQLSKQMLMTDVDIDINFDGVFDERDVSPYLGYNYGVLTSEHAFSCGNTFPWFMHEHGAMILGERTTGGSCAIRVCSVGGIECVLSYAFTHMIADSGENIDFGCPVDAELLTDGENPYENFYDLDLLSAKMNEFFGGAAADAA